MARNWRGRAAVRFARNERDLQDVISSMLADYSAKGRLGSGATARSATKLFEAHIEAALDGVLAEAAKLIEHRGRQWRRAIRGIGEALTAYLATAPTKLSAATKLSGARESPAAMEQLDRELTAMTLRLETRLIDFGDGWTAPIPKEWKDRHALQYASILLVIGAVIGSAVPIVARRLQSQFEHGTRAANSNVDIDDRLTYLPGEQRTNPPREWRGGVLSSSQDAGAGAVAPGMQAPPNEGNATRSQH